MDNYKTDLLNWVGFLLSITLHCFHTIILCVCERRKIKFCAIGVDKVDLYGDKEYNLPNFIFSDSLKNGRIL